MARLTPEEAAQKWAQRTQGAQADWQRGVERVTESPTAKAAASAALWQRRTSDPATAEKFKRNVGRVSKETWQAKTVAAGGRFSSGAAQNQDKMLEHQKAVAAHIEAGRRKIAAMPKGTAADAAARAAAWVMHMAEYRRPS